MLADIGVHFLALASTIHDHLELIDVARTIDPSGAERSTCKHRLGSGMLTIHAFNGADTRRTQVELRIRPVTSSWTDSTVSVRFGKRTTHRHRVPSLTDRDHVDTLYRPLYQDLLACLRYQPCRARRTAEALTVNEALLALLAAAPILP